ncbi:MAG: low molecular weight protein-tyrosine-phosphatase, partial [Saprospiraceae bacterium]
MKILLVCLGNICRSPMAEGILRDKIEKAGLDIQVDSAGTANYHVGEPPHKYTIKVAAENGLDIRDLKARQFQTKDFDDFDIIYVMDSSNHSD